MARFIAERGVAAFPHVNDDTGRVWSEFGVTYQPTFVFVTADGSRTTFGAMGESEIAARIDELF